MEEFVNKIRAAQEEVHNGRPFDELVLEDLMEQIDRRKMRDAIAFFMPCLIDGTYVNTTYRKEALMTLIAEFKNDADILYIKEQMEGFSYTVLPSDYDLNSDKSDIIDSKCFILRFRSCYYDRFNQDDGYLDSEYIEALLY